MDLSNLINEILSLRSQPLQFFGPEEIPQDIATWMIGHGTEIELGVLAGVIAGLMMRGADPADCARYSIDATVPLPFEGCEGKILEVILADMIERGHTPRRLAQLVEIVCIACETALRFKRSPERLVTFVSTRECARA